MNETILHPINQAISENTVKEQEVIINAIEETPLLPTNTTQERPSQPQSPAASNAPTSANSEQPSPTDQVLLASEVESVEPATASGFGAAKILGGLGALGAIAALASGGGGGGDDAPKKNNKTENPAEKHDKKTGQPDNPQIPEQNIQPPASNKEQADTHQQPESPPETSPIQPVVLTTRILYKDGSVLTHKGSADNPFQTGMLKYSESNPIQQSHNKTVLPSKEKITSLETYIANNSDFLNKNIISSYGKDTDGDGLIDLKDPYPNSWNVSDRDLRMFATLAYEDESSLKAIFNDQSIEVIEQINRDSKKFNGQADVAELIQHWHLLKVHNSSDITGSGLDYAIFGNGKTEKGYENIVVAFRGSSNVGDWTANGKILFGLLPTQAKDLSYTIDDVQYFNPEKIYSTGHSLGGYLAQYFAAHNIQSTPSLKEYFIRNTLFNPAKIDAKFWSNKNLKNAEKNTEKLLEEYIWDNGEQHKKTTPFVIKREWVGDALGTYKNTIFFEDSRSWGKHDMVSFYNKNSKMQQYFTQGYRTDTHYQNIDTDKDGLTDIQEYRIGTNPNLADSDGDGFSDGIEIKLASNASDAGITPYTTGSPLIETDNRPFVAIVQTEDDKGRIIGIKGIEMQADQLDGEIVYTPSGKEFDLAGSGFDWSAFESQNAAKGLAFLNGTSGNDTLQGSKGNDYLWGNLGKDTLIGGEGSDTFAFKATDIRQGEADIIKDFHPQEDYLDLSGMRSLFEDRSQGFKWSDVLVNDKEIFNDTLSSLHFNSQEQTLSYHKAGAKEGIVFAQFDGEHHVNIGSEHLIG
ncbi:DUF2974 domain-containing protein [Neisseria sp. 83E34]|uniref:DUF2974 domain-containing protein n=1 Tax=Neisseria sp. 83E34 TaxID=1692264 RepID=UPI0006CE94D7|nr:DUF2974 domain-containing protein [Neisseria sp. 83E34]